MPDCRRVRVEEMVYPSLDRGAAALDDFAFAARLRTFVGRFDNPTIIYDFPVDLALLVAVLDGFERFERSAPDAAASMPSYTTESGLRELAPAETARRRSMPCLVRRRWVLRQVGALGVEFLAGLGDKREGDELSAPFICLFSVEEEARAHQRPPRKRNRRSRQVDPHRGSS